MELEQIALCAIDCAKTYPDGTRGLLPSNLRVEPGEIMALLGPSGCGKTTLLRILAGLESPDDGGTILFGEQDVTQCPIEQRRVGMVFQHYALFPNMSARRNVEYGLRVRGTDRAKRDKIVGELIDLVRLNGLEHKRPNELSGGQRQRVALARAVAAQPKILLLDEPLTALDSKLKDALRDELAELLRRLGITAIYVTHDQQEAMAVADRLAVMQSGQIMQIGDAESLYRNPTHTFVANFLGRVNIIRRDAEQTSQGTLLLGDALFTVPSYLGEELLVRPEDLVIDQPRVGRAAGIIENRSFRGDRVHLRVAIDGQEPFSVDVARDSLFKRGDIISVAINPSTLMRAKEA
jgi:putative spermidine/putrescine transport system ATP-binding protein